MTFFALDKVETGMAVVTESGGNVRPAVIPEGKTAREMMARSDWMQEKLAPFGSLSVAVANLGALAVGGSTVQELVADFGRQWEAERGPGETVGAIAAALAAELAPRYSEGEGSLYVAGYPGAAPGGEVWRIGFHPRKPPTLTLELDGATNGLRYAGTGGYAVWRLVEGYDVDVPRIVAERLGLDGAAQRDLRTALSENVGVDLTHAGMSLRAAVDLVDWLADLACSYEAFTAPAPTVARPVDLAVITPADGFRWIRHEDRLAGLDKSPWARREASRIKVGHSHRA